MRKKLLFFGLLFLSVISIAKSQELNSTTPLITNPVQEASPMIEEIVSKVKMAKEYFMTSTDTAAGNSHEDRTNRLRLRIQKHFLKFRERRTSQYQYASMVFKGLDWATGHTATKTVSIPQNMYTFTKMERTTSGDWKGGPSINYVRRENWFEGDIPGGPVTWMTGGHGKATTVWTIYAKYSAEYINAKIDSEVAVLKQALHSLNLPSYQVQ